MPDLTRLTPDAIHRLAADIVERQAKGIPGAFKVPTGFPEMMEIVRRKRAWIEGELSNEEIDAWRRGLEQLPGSSGSAHVRYHRAARADLLSRNPKTAVAAALAAAEHAAYDAFKNTRLHTREAGDEYSWRCEQESLSIEAWVAEWTETS